MSRCPRGHYIEPRLLDCELSRHLGVEPTNVRVVPGLRRERRRIRVAPCDHQIDIEIFDRKGVANAVLVIQGYLDVAGGRGQGLGVKEGPAPNDLQTSSSSTTTIRPVPISSATGCRDERGGKCDKDDWPDENYASSRRSGLLCRMRDRRCSLRGRGRGLFVATRQGTAVEFSGQRSPRDARPQLISILPAAATCGVTLKGALRKGVVGPLAVAVSRVPQNLGGTLSACRPITSGSYLSMCR